MVIASALTLLAAACSSADPKEPQVRLVEVPREVPAEAKKPCDRPSDLPDRDLKQGEVVTFWNRDRAALRACERRRALAAGG